MDKVIGHLKSELHRKRNLLEGYYNHDNLCVEWLITKVSEEVKEFEHAISVLETHARVMEVMRGICETEVHTLPNPPRYGISQEVNVQLFKSNSDIGCNLGELK